MMNLIEQLVKEICDKATIVYGEEDIIGDIAARYIIASQMDKNIALDAEKYLDKCE